MTGNNQATEMPVGTNVDFQQLVELSLEEKEERSLAILRNAVESYEKISVACSGGKDSMVVVHLAQKINPDISVFSLMTLFKPVESFIYLKMMKEKMELNLDVYLAGTEAPEELNGLNIILLSELAVRFNKYSDEIKRYWEINGIGDAVPALYEIAPSLCCDLLKTSPAKEAVKGLDAWICGLRNTEGRTRGNYQEIEEKEQGLVKINPILPWTEDDIWNYMSKNDIEPHPWYSKRFADGRRIRSLGCAPCTVPIYDYQDERDGRWKGTGKCGGECGIHTQPLKSS